MTWHDDFIMRTIIELPGEQLDALDALCRRDGISRAEAVRRAVALLVRAKGGLSTPICARSRLTVPRRSRTHPAGVTLSQWVYRLYRLEGLQVRLRTRRKKRLRLPHGAVPPAAISTGAWTSWHSVT